MTTIDVALKKHLRSELTKKMKSQYMFRSVRTNDWHRNVEVDSRGH